MAENKKQMMLTLSFKEDERWLFEEICKHSSKGGWIKDVLTDYLRGQIVLNADQKISESTKEIEEISKMLDF